MHFHQDHLDNHARQKETHMADLPPYRDTGDNTGDNTGVGPDRSLPSGTPRWVKVFAIIALVVVLLFVISLLAGVRHGPGLHTPSGHAGGHTPPTSVIADYTPPGSDFGGHA
jgi:hypothetical protein